MKRIIIGVLITVFLGLFSFSSFSAQRIRFGVIYFYPPFVFSSKSGYIHGFDIDVATAICQQINAQCSFQAMSLVDSFSALKANKIDAVMGAISITPERQTQFDFTKPYFKSTMSYVSIEGSNIDPNKLQGHKVGVVKDSTFQRYLTNKYNGTIKLSAYDTNEALANALSNHEIDIMLIDTPAANFWIGYTTGMFQTVGVPESLSFDLGYGIMINKGKIQLFNALNSGLEKISNNGSLDKIKQKYFKQVIFQHPE